METNNEAERYSISLADKQSWEIAATLAADSWQKRLVRILGLKKGRINSCNNRLIICRKLDELEAIRAAENCLSENILRNWDYPPLKLFTAGEGRDLICELHESKGYSADTLRMMLALYPIYRQAQTIGGLPMHAALMELSGQGFLITAASGTGKSTCARRVPEPWMPLCDDEALIVRDPSGCYHVHPFPTWSEFVHNSTRTWEVQRHVPLKGIFILRRSEKDDVLSVGQEEAITIISHSVSQVYSRIWSFLDDDEKKEIMKVIFRNSYQIAKSIPVYALYASLTGRFWEHMERAVSGGADLP